MTATKSKDDNVQHSLTTCNLDGKNNPSLAVIRSSNNNLSGLERHNTKLHAEDGDTAPKDKVSYVAVAIKSTCCGSIFANADQYVRHCVRFHSPLLAFGYLNDGADLVDAILCNLKRTVVFGSAYKCEFCDIRFLDLPSLFHHESLHDPADGFSCYLCELNVPTLAEILAHRVSILEVNKRTYGVEFPNMANVYCCNVCTEEFHALHELYNHRYALKHFFPRQTAKQLQMRGLIDHCAICGYLSNNASELEQHLLAHHTMNGSRTNANAGARRSRKTRAIKQEKSKVSPRPYLCEKCGKTFTQTSHLFQHLRFHNGVRPFVCPRYGCGRSFTIRPDLNDHIRKCHTGERPYRCEVCDKRFLTGSVYYQHRLIHRGERRYACPVCDKRFLRTDALKNHQRIHTGEKPFACHICKRPFRQRGDRNKHALKCH